MTHLEADHSTSKPLCSFTSCNKEVKSLGLCIGHYAQQYKGKPLTPIRKRIPLDTPDRDLCSFASCTRPVKCRNLCEGHYNQQCKGKPLTPLREFLHGGSVGICSVRNCDRPKFAKHVCSAHWYQQHKGKPFTAIRVQRKGGSQGECQAPDCDRPAVTRYLCSVHATLDRQGKPLRPINIVKSRGDRFEDEKGYVVLRRPGHPNCFNGNLVYEHRAIMAETLGRPLSPDENVHHKNGVRNDNRPENLELWSASQPPGQRVADRIQWAREVLRRYEPDHLRDP